MKKQEDFFKLNREFAPNRISHGDGSGVGKRKLARPFKRNCAIHLVFKSENAKGKMNLRNASHQISVDRIISTQARRFSVKVHADQNVGNHLHLIISCGRRENFQNFLRAVAGLIARAVLRGKRGQFWTQLPFTRLIMGARDYASMLKYITKNLIEVTFGADARKEFEAGESIARKERQRELARARRKKFRQE